jgi:uncharacterized protein YkwD
MKRLLLIIFILSYPMLSQAGFNWGGSGGSCSGSGNFEQQIKNNDTVDVGEIPIGKEGVYIKLTSDKDVDIQLYDKTSNEAIIAWPSGILSGSNTQTTNYQGISIEWSGYNGENGKYGHEYIKISNTTNRVLLMKAFGYQAGYATVDYSWTGTEGCTEGTGVAASGSGSFEQEILKQAIIEVGEIPVGLNDLSIKLVSSNDVDIQLYEADNGTAIIAWPSGILNGSNKQTINYQGMNIEWSGYHGDGSGLGHEYIKITGVTTQKLIMKAYGYAAGYAKVDYTWGASDSSGGTGGSTGNNSGSCALITNDSNYNDVFPSDVNWSANGSDVAAIATAFNTARAKDSTITQTLVMPSQSVWDGMDNQAKALYLLNKERYDRGIKPYEGIDQNVVTVAQNYANLLYNTGTFGHKEDGSPWDRLDKVNLIKNNKDFFGYAENLYASASTASYTKNPIAKSIYNWIYDDASSSWGHRIFALARLKDNSGDNGAEGLLGMGITTGDAYSFYPGYKSTIVVMNVFDPATSWNHANTVKVSICTASN